MSRNVRLILLCVGVGMLGLAIGLGPSLFRGSIPSETTPPSDPSGPEDAVQVPSGAAEWDRQLGSPPRFVDVANPL